MHLHAKTTGAGPDLIVLHGLFGSLENLGRVSALLSKSHRVHALDLRNHGRSFHDELMDYTLMANDVLRYMDQNGLITVSVLGHSMGGKVAMTLAQQHGGRINALIVADIAPVAYPPHHAAILAALKKMPLADIASRSDASRYLKEQGIEEDLIPFLLKNLQQNEGKFTWRINLGAISENYGEIMGETAFHRPFSKPALFLIGEQSDYVKPEHRHSIERMFPSAKAKVIAGTSHWLHAQKPETFALLCQKFLMGIQERKISS